MIDLGDIRRYHENNRIEAKKSLGGLPHSIWETYSAFANTLGGLILLGVEEYRDKSLHPIDLPDPEGLAARFWSMVNDPAQVSANILTEENVSILPSEGKRIVVIDVPRASRYDRPVYVGGDAGTGTYRRNGEGDYRCTPEEIRAMRRDSAARTQDMRVLEELDASALDGGTLSRFRAGMEVLRPGHPWLALPAGELLGKLGALEGDPAHPTAAGLLMFGRTADIRGEYPDYRLEYRERDENGEEGFSSDDGGWSGNLWDFYLRVYDRLVWDIEDGGEEDGAALRRALREALANCLEHADYYGRRGLSVVKEGRVIRLENPGSFRVDPSAARRGGRSDPRNGALSRMFALAGVGQGSGGGLTGIYQAWARRGWSAPVLKESFGPERVSLCLVMERPARTRAETAEEERQRIVEYLTDAVSASPAALGQALSMGPSRTETRLRELEAQELVIREEDGNVTLRAKPAPEPKPGTDESV